MIKPKKNEKLILKNIIFRIMKLLNHEIYNLKLLIPTFAIINQII